MVKKSNILSLLGALALSTVMNAATIDLTSSNANLFQLSTNANSAGNTYRILNIGSGVTLSITSFWLDATNANNTYQNSRTSLWNTGIGSCNPNETCSTDPNHRVDNYGRYEVVLFRFSAPVDIDGFKLSASCPQSGNCADTDATYWLADLPNNFSGTIAGLTQSNVNSLFGAGSNVDFTASTLSTRTATIANNNYSDSFLLGARWGQTDDYFKIKSIEVTFDPRIPGNEVPEPTTYALIGGALVALGIYRNKRRG